jgi:hypothetical protein
MATILDPQLSIQVDRQTASASVNVTCDLEFTNSEVESMNILGTSLERPVFDAIAPTRDLKLNGFGTDSLVGELRLINANLDTVTVKRTPTIKEYAHD